MILKPLVRLLAAACVLLSLSAPGGALAEDVVVDNRGGGDFRTIQAAIDHVRLRLPSEPNTSFFIRVKSSTDTYFGPITPISNVPIIGESTADTIIGGSGTLIKVSNVSSVTIRNFTFRSANTAISVADSGTAGSIKITNSVFDLGTTGTAIRVLNSPSTQVINNTFFRNGTAISTNSDIEIVNNIFANNTLAIDDQTTLNKLSYCDFFQNLNDGVNLDPKSIPNSQHPDANPRFVDTAGRDFHLQQDSAAKNSGSPNFPNSFNNRSDMGAYGGLESNSPISTVTGVTTEEEGDSIRVSWSPASNSSVEAYRVYFGPSSRGANQNSYPSSQIVLAPGTSTLLSDLPATTPETLGTPSQVRLTPRKEALLVEWSAVPGATGYRVYYRANTTFDQATLSDALIWPVDGGSTTSTVIPDLIDGTTYFVAVAARAQNRVFVAVTAVIDRGLSPSPGGDNESEFSAELVRDVGDAVESPISQPIPESPEAISPFPSLPNEGCFIATAAYGFYSAPQVQVLREFRDRYLMTNAPGRAFVDWYYHYGPYGARFINEHPWLKPPVRLALMPLIALALFLLKTSPLVKIVILLLTVPLSACLFKRLKSVREKVRDVQIAGGGVE